MSDSDLTAFLRGGHAAKPGTTETAELFRAYLVASTTSMYRMSPDWKEMRQLDGQGFLCNTDEPRTDWLQNYIHPDDQPQVMAGIEEAIRTKKMFDLEHRVRLANGSLGWVRSRAIPIVDARGEIVEWFGAAIDVTERKRMEDALRASEERFRLLYEAQHTAHLVLAPDLIIEGASAAYLRVTRTREEDLIGKPLLEAFPANPADPTSTAAQNLLDSIASVLEHRRAHRMSVQKYDIRRPSGEYEVRWWAPLNIPVLGPDGNVRQIIHQVEDVTAEMLERQKTADARAGEARFRAMAEAIPGFVFEADETGRNHYVNGWFASFTGLSMPELCGHRWLWILHPDDRERAAAIWARALRSPSPYENEYRVRRADGAWRWFAARAWPIRDDAGRVEKWIGVCIDVDDTKRAERALREREEQFRSMADALPQLAWMADENGWIYWYNRRWYEYTGTTHEQMEGWGWRKVHHPDHVDRVVERIQHSWGTGEPWEDTFPLRSADGRYRWFLSRAVPLRDSEGRIVRWFGTNTDITEQQEREDFQKLLLHEVSHRVKNSLALVAGLLHVQARTCEAETRRMLEDASARVGTVAKVHDQLWRQAGAREIDLASFLSNLAAAIATAAPRHRTSVDVETAVISADAAVPIGLLINELVTNAYKHAYPDGDEGEVRITGTRACDGRYRLEVIDAGRGLPKDFELMRAQGSLGIRVVTSLVAQLNGELTVSSANPGSRFTIVLPIG